MLNALIIGNLGADAETKIINDYQFVSFRVAHTRKYTNPTTGEQVERTLWVSCTMRGDGGRLLPYLKRGTKVYIHADELEPTLYVSSKDGQQHAGLNCRVRQIELCGSNQQSTDYNPDAIKRYLSLAPDNVLQMIGVSRPTISTPAQAQQAAAAAQQGQQNNLPF